MEGAAHPFGVCDRQIALTERAEGLGVPRGRYEAEQLVVRRVLMNLAEEVAEVDESVVPAGERIGRKGGDREVAAFLMQVGQAAVFQRRPVSALK